MSAISADELSSTDSRAHNQRQQISTNSLSSDFTVSKSHSASNKYITEDKIWKYFKQSIDDQNKTMCLLCSTELCHNISNTTTTPATTTSNIPQELVHNHINGGISKNGHIITNEDINNNDVLWDHLKKHHSIERSQTSTNDANPEIIKTNGDMLVKRVKSPEHTETTEERKTIVAKSTHRKKSHDSISNSHQKPNQKLIMTNLDKTNSLNLADIRQKKSKDSSRSASLPRATTKSNKSPPHKSSDHKSSNNQQTKLRRNLDLMDYYDYNTTSMKPSASSSNSQSSLPRQIITRLNELSSPVARKLRFWNKKSFEVNQYDPSFKVIYLGNLGMQFLSKDEQCLEKPLNTLWNNYLVYMKTEIVMRLTICNSGLKAITRQHGLTQYWSNRLVYCFTHKNYPKIFSWIYRHEGKKMRQELRCHAVFCSSPDKASRMVQLLNQRLACALQEFKREKKSRELPSIMTKSDHWSKDSQTIQMLQQTLPRTVPLRRQILAKGSANFRPPLDRSKSAPKLTAIREEDYDELDVSSDETCSNSSETKLSPDGRHWKHDRNKAEIGDNDGDESQDEYEFEQSFDDNNDDDDYDDDGDYDEDELERFITDQLCVLNLTDVDNQSTRRAETDSSVTNTVNDLVSTSDSTCAAEEESYLDPHSATLGSANSNTLRSADQPFERGTSIRLSRRSGPSITRNRSISSSTGSVRGSGGAGAISIISDNRTPKQQNESPHLEITSSDQEQQLILASNDPLHKSTKTIKQSHSERKDSVKETTRTSANTTKQNKQ